MIFIWNASVLASQYRTLYVEDDRRWDASWLRRNKSADENILDLINILKNSISGHEILERASAKARLRGETLVDIINIGEISTADSTLVRKFYPDSPENVVYEVRSKVFINKDLSLMDAVLDLAHELTHFVERPPFNPYSSNFNLIGFIKSTIEGRGGEVDAYISECRVLYDLFRESNRYANNCRKIYDDNSGVYSRVGAIKAFYRVGNSYSLLERSLRTKGLTVDSLPAISSEDAAYISSAYGVPYPLASIYEFRVILEKVCKNNSRRLEIMRETLARAPADDSRTKKYNEMFIEYNNQCLP